MAAQHPFLNTITEVNSSYLDKLFDMAKDALGDAVDAANSVSAELTPLPDFSGLNPTLVNPSDIVPDPLPAMPVKPPQLNVPIDAMPNAPILTTELIATDSLLTTLIARIVAECEYRLTNPTGIKAAVEAAIWAKAVSRETKLQRSAYQTYLASNSAMGFEAASGQDQAAFVKMETEKRLKLSDINRDIAIKQAELEQNNIQKTLDLFQTLQAQLFDQKRSDESNKIRLFESKIKAVIDKAMLYIDINKGFVDIYASEVQAYGALASVTNEQARFRMEQYKQINDMNLQLTNISLEKIKLIEQHYQNNAQVGIEKLKTIASINGQVGANWMNGINLSQSFSTGKHWGYGESISA